VVRASSVAMTPLVHSQFTGPRWVWLEKADAARLPLIRYTDAWYKPLEGRGGVVSGR
jgi:hypothetical protein